MMLQFSFTTMTSCQNFACRRLMPMHPDFFTPIRTEDGRFLYCFECIERVRIMAAKLEDDYVDN